MKSAIALLIVATCSAVQLSAEAFPNGNTEKNHWRKTWPEGFDNGDDDGAVINAFSLPLEKKSKKADHQVYGWEYDHDVIATGKSLDIAEKQRNEKLTYDSVAVKRGRDMVFENNPMHEKHLMEERLKKAPEAAAAASPAAAAAPADAAAPSTGEATAAAPAVTAAGMTPVTG